MDYNVLGLGYSPNEYDLIRKEWEQRGIHFEFSVDVEDAIEKIRQREYICIVIRSDDQICGWFETLRSISSVPLVILPSPCLAKGMIILTQKGINAWTLADRYQKGTIIKPGHDNGLTIRKFKDMCFCLEYRTIEIRGNEIELTEKEFDILSLLLMNPKKVFSYEMIIDAVWHEAPTFYSSKTVSTHISNLRRKLKIEPDIPEYIKSVRGIGYKFEIPE